MVNDVQSKQDWEIIDYEQKFKIGNVVEHIGLYNTGKKAIIEYSYFDKFGGNNKHNKSIYSIIEMEDGRSHAWTDEKHLKFISEGGEELIKEAKLVRQKINEAETSLKYIVDTFNDGLNSNQILYLFDRIGHIPKSFLNEGSYIYLMMDWDSLRLLFVYIISLEASHRAHFNEWVNSNPSLNEEKIMILFDEVKALQL